MAVRRQGQESALLNVPNMENLPLLGIKILDPTSSIAGPFSGAILADLGGDVINIETPSGDAARYISPIKGDRSVYFHIVDRNEVPHVIVSA